MSVTTPNKKKVSPEQLSYMLDYLNENKILLHGKTKPSEANENRTEKLWDALTLSLNAMGSGPTKNKAQWKKTFIDWKSHTKKKARVCVKSGQKTGGGERDAKQLTPLEEKLMALLSWITVRGADINEVGFEEEIGDEYEGIGRKSPVAEVNQTEGEFVDDSTLEETIVIHEVTPVPSTSRKRLADQAYQQTNKRSCIKEKSSTLQKAAEVYAIGQKETAQIMNKLLMLRENNTTPGTIKISEKELELREMELKIRFLEAKNKSRELDLKERELRIREKELELKTQQ